MIDGRVPHALLLEIFTNRGVGTQVDPDPEPAQPTHEVVPL